MNITEEQYSRLSRFMDADMELAEMEAFAQELKANPALRAQLDFEQSVRDGFAFKTNKEAALPGQETVLPGVTTSNEKQNSKHQSAPIKKIAGRKKWLAMAVAATVLAAVTSLVYYETTKQKQSPAIVKQKENPAIKKNDTTAVAHTNSTVTNDTAKVPDVAVVFKQYFTKDELPERYPMYLADAFMNAENGREAKLQQLNLSNIGETRGEDERQEILQLGHYYKGISFLKTGNTVAAITNLQWVVQHSADTSLTVKAQWYLALAFIKNKEVDKAVKGLKKISGSKHVYTERVKKLLKELKS